MTGVRRGQLCVALALALSVVATPLAAKDSLGVFGQWGAFRDPTVPRCYAVAMAQKNRADRDYQPFASIGTWPSRAVRGQVHFRLSRKLAGTAAITLSLAGQRFTLAGGGDMVIRPANGWPGSKSHRSTDSALSTSHQFR